MQAVLHGFLTGGADGENEVEFGIKIGAAGDMPFEGPGHVGESGADAAGLGFVLNVVEEQLEQVLNAGEAGDLAFGIHDGNGADFGAFHALVDIEERFVLAGLDDIGAADGLGGGPQVHDEVGSLQSGPRQHPAGAGIQSTAAGSHGVGISRKAEKLRAADGRANRVGIGVFMTNHVDRQLARAGFFKGGLNHAKWKL